MNVLRYTGYTLIAAAALTALSIRFSPNFDFASYIPQVLLAGLLLSAAIAVLSFLQQDRLNMHDKNILMAGMMLAVLVPSLYSVGAFIHEGQTSWSGGEIHWHADFEVIVQGSPERLGFQPSEDYSPPEKRCKKVNGEYLCQLDLIDPSNYCQEHSKESTYMCKINDRVGITKYHEHNDKRIHLEGTFNQREDATLAAFFETFEGRLTDGQMKFPTNDKVYETQEGDEKTLKVAVKKGVGGDRAWNIINPEQYVISPHKRGPLLDDIFIIYDSRSEQQVLKDLNQDDKYRGLEMFKAGEK